MFEGIVLAAVSAIFFGLAVAIQKYSLSSQKKFTIKNMITNTKWIAAFVIGILGILIYMVALNLETLATVQPITSANIIIPILAGSIFFKEKLGVKKWGFVIITVIGILLVSLF